MDVVSAIAEDAGVSVDITDLRLSGDHAFKARPGCRAHQCPLRVNTSKSHCNTERQVKSQKSKVKSQRSKVLRFAKCAPSSNCERLKTVLLCAPAASAALLTFDF